MKARDIVERALVIVEQAIELEGLARRSFLDSRCAGDAELRREVESLLEREVGLEIAADTDLASVPEIVVRYDADDRYTLHDEIARGGMGQIIRATDRDLGREVAVKIVHEEHGDDPEINARFLNEARIMGWLQHPGIPAVYDVGRFASGRRFIAMKLVRGRSLASLLSEGARPGDGLCLRIFESLCQTIAFAHARGIVHRDVKPDNIMVGEFGEVQVIDWGLACAADASAPRPEAEREAPTIDDGRDLPPGVAGRPTHIGRAMGTPSYMPPEQFAGVHDSRTDVFALGAILCEILTGSPPYVGETPADLLEKSARADLHEARARLDDADADGELIGIARRCLEQDADRRPGDASEVVGVMQSYRHAADARVHAAELERARAEEAARQEHGRRRLTVVLAGTVVGALVIMIGLMESHNQRMHARAESMNLVHSAASMLRLNQPTYARVIPVLEEATRLDPDNAIAFAELSGAYVRLNRWDDAMITAERAIDLDSDQHAAYYNIANVLNARGQPLRAAHMADAGLAVDQRPDDSLAIMFRFKSAFFRIDAAFGGDATIGALEDEQVEELLRQALVPMRTNLEHFSSAENGWPVERVLRQTLVSSITNGTYYWPRDQGYAEIMQSEWRADPRYTRLRDPEVLRGLSPELREGWQQVWNDVDAAIARSTTSP